MEAEKLPSLLKCLSGVSWERSWVVSYDFSEVLPSSLKLNAASLNTRSSLPLRGFTDHPGLFPTLLVKTYEMTLYCLDHFASVFSHNAVRRQNGQSGPTGISTLTGGILLVLHVALQLDLISAMFIPYGVLHNS